MFLGSFNVRKAFVATIVAIGIHTSHWKAVNAHRVRNDKRHTVTRAATHSRHFWPKKMHDVIHRMDKDKSRKSHDLSRLVATRDFQHIPGVKNESVQSDFHLPLEVPNSDPTGLEVASSDPKWQVEHLDSGPSRISNMNYYDFIDSLQLQPHKVSSQGDKSQPEKNEGDYVSHKILNQVLMVLRLVVFESSHKPRVVFPALLLGISIMVIVLSQVAIPWVVHQIRGGLHEKSTSLTNKGQHGIERKAFMERGGFCAGAIQPERHQALVQAILKSCSQNKALATCPDSEWMESDATKDGPSDSWEPLDD